MCNFLFHSRWMKLSHLLWLSRKCLFILIWWKNQPLEIRVKAMTELTDSSIKHQFVLWVLNFYKNGFFEIVNKISNPPLDFDIDQDKLINLSKALNIFLRLLNTHSKQPPSVTLLRITENIFKLQRGLTF